MELDSLRYIGIYEEPAGSYQVDHSGTPGDFLPVPYREDSLEAQGAREMLDPATGKMRVDGHDKKVLGRRSCSVNVSCTLHSHGLDLDGNTAPPTTANWGLLRALKTIMGGSFAAPDVGAQTEVLTGSTPTEVTVTAGHGTRFRAGGAIACEVTPGSPVLEAREIKSVAGDTITVKEAFSSAPVEGSAVRGAVTVYLTEDPSTSLQAIVEGRGDTDGAVFRGLQGGFTLELPVGELGTISLALEGAGWERLGVSAKTSPVYQHYEVMALSPLAVHVPKIGDTTLVSVCASAVSVEPAIAYAPVRCGAAPETVGRMKRQPARPVVTASFTAPLDERWFAARDDREDRAFFVQAGALAGGMVLISLPTVQVTEVQPAPSGENIAGVTVTVEGRHDEEIGGSTEEGYSALRLHFF